MSSKKSRLSLKELYSSKIMADLKKEFGYKNIHEIPKLVKVTINMGLGGKAIQDKKNIDKATADLVLLACQKPIVTNVKRSEAGFKIRTGWPIGAKVTLRRNNMYNFLERLLWVSLPLSRDFRGLNRRSFDGRGNYSFGVRDQSIFREIPYEQIDSVRGMDITITTTAKNDKEAYALLLALGLPFAGVHKQAQAEE